MRIRVLDTMTVSALMQGDVAAVDRLASLGPRHVLLPQPVVAEIHYGLERLPPSRRRARLAERFRSIARAIERAPWSEAVSAAFGRIKADLERRGTRIEDFDIAIAAHALASRAILATSNLRHMQRITGLDVEDWASPSR